MRRFVRHARSAVGTPVRQRRADQVVFAAHAPISIVSDRRGRSRRRAIRVDLNEVRRGLAVPGAVDLAVWRPIRSRLERCVGEDAFAIWLEPVQPIAVDGDQRLVVAAPAPTAEWTTARFSRLITAVASELGRDVPFANQAERRAFEECAPDDPIRINPGGSRMIITISNQKGGVGKTTTAANLAVLLARQHRRVLVIDSDPQDALTRQLGAEDRSLSVNLVDVLAGRAPTADAIVPNVHGIDLIAAAPTPAGV